jgi:hypothetical protein
MMVRIKVSAKYSSNNIFLLWYYIRHTFILLCTIIMISSVHHVVISTGTAEETGPNSGQARQLLGRY